MAVKPKRRDPAGQLWRVGFRGLKRLQQTIDAVLEAMPNEELAMSGLPDIKLRLNRELRENAAAELKLRRERFELHDMELARAAKARSDDELLEAVRRMSAGRPPDPAAADRPLDGLVDIGGGLLGVTSSSESHPGGTDQEATTEQTQVISDELEARRAKA